ncbi:hypothetical protein DDZ14_13565 [Maritimibacter sp. 55A14]|uniref:hypothetical protein n=1 Tax=Maritimibacter sp. 55A14 TaxID=2174844 RepID=UPI000D612193|nr:hypothetical protein [Maritimibacter sp. 55A14]PWE31215.1 hypothetical protein DDZ14_13565 [Maritimibacter sp. 55A14]
MIELVFIVCLSAAPDQCEERAMQYNNLSARDCVYGAMPYLSRWVSEHPQWQVERWTCQPMGEARHRA